MLRLEWTTPAADELEAAQAYYHDLNPIAARVLASRIVEAAMRLREQPQIGRAGLQVVEILHVWHAAQDWQRSD